MSRLKKKKRTLETILEETPCLETAWSRQIGDYVEALAFSPDGTIVAAASVSGPVFLFDAGSGSVLGEAAGHGMGTTSLSWHPSSGLVATSGQDGCVRLWDRTSAPARVLKCPAAWVMKTSFEPNGSRLAAISGKTLQVWDEEGQEILSASEHPSSLADLGWKPDGSAIAVAAYNGVTIWRPESPVSPVRLTWKGSSLDLAWSPDGRFIATGEQDETIHFWYADTGRDSQMSGYPKKVRQLAWSASSRYLATGGGGAVVIWDCSGKGPENTEPLELKGHQAPLTSLSYQARGPLLLSGDESGQLFLWDPETLREPLGKAAEWSAISRTAWSPRGECVAAGTADGTVRLMRF